MKVSFCVVVVVCARSEWQEAHAVLGEMEEGSLVEADGG